MEPEAVETPELSDLEFLNQEEPEAPASAPEPEVEPEGEPPAEGEPAKPGEGEPAKPAEGQPAKPAEPELPAGVKSLRDQINQNADLKKVLEQNPKLRDRLYADARRSQELGEFKKHFATSELAQAARADAEDWSTVAAHFESKTPDGYNAVLNRMAEASIARDQAGNPLLNSDGTYQSTGMLEGFLRHQREQYFWPEILRVAQEQGADDVVEAAQNLMQFLNEGGKDVNGTPPASPRGGASKSSPDLPPEVRERLARLESLERQQGTSAETAARQYQEGVSSSVSNAVRTTIEERVKRFAPALSSAIQKRVTDDTFKEIDRQAGADTFYKNTYLAQLRRANGSEEVKTRLVGMAVNYARNIAGPLIQKYVNEFSTDAIASNNGKVAKINQQKAQANVKGAGDSGTPIRQGDLHQSIREARTLSQQLFKRDLSDMEILNIEETLPNFQRMAKQRQN